MLYMNDLCKLCTCYYNTIDVGNRMAKTATYVVAVGKF